MDSKPLRKIIGCIRKAVDDYGMISEGDRIGVGLSGGKDSLVLTAALAFYRRFSPVKIQLHAINIDMGFKGIEKEREALSRLMEELEVPYHTVKTDIAEVVFDVRKESNPCSLCSKMRRGALNGKCVELGLNKLALGHNADDLVETFFLSMIYEGRLNTFQPVSYMSRTGITLIRPLIYVDEADIKGATVRAGLTPLPNPCPENHHTEREHIKDIIRSVQEEIPIAKDRILSALTSPERYSLLPPKKTKH